MKPLNRLTLLTLPILSSVVLSGFALAATSAPTLSLSLMKVTVVTKDGVKQDVLSSADKVNPGDVLLQRATLRNARALKNGRIVLPVPKNTSFLAGTASTYENLKMDFSIDAGKNYSEKPTRTVTVTENGKTVSREVLIPPNEYTNVRWSLSNLPAGSELTVGFRVTVN